MIDSLPRDIVWHGCADDSLEERANEQAARLYHATRGKCRFVLFPASMLKTPRIIWAVEKMQTAG